MKNLYLILCASFVILFSGCDKEAGIDTKNLSQCPTGSDCEYFFKTNAGIRLQEEGPVAGDSTVFVYQQKTLNYSATSYLLIRAGKNAKSFRIEKNELQKGHVNYAFVCPACDYILLKPVDGYVEGRKISDTQWLLDARVILAAPHDGRIRDTIEVRQNFILKKSN